MALQTKKVISLLPSAAEIIALITDDTSNSIQLVGRSHEDDYPSYVTSLPILTAPKTKFTTSADVDVQVSQLLAEGKSLYELDKGLLKSLKPDVIVTQDLCNVCSIDLNTVQKIAKEMDPVPDVVTLSPMSIEDVVESVRKVGLSLGAIEKSDKVISSLQSRIKIAKEAASRSKNNGLKPVKVAFFEWCDPIYLGGHWTPQLIRWSNGIQVINDCKDEEIAQAGASPSFRVPPQEILDSKPEILIICPCGLNLDETKKEYEKTLLPSNWWPELANNAKKIALVDGNQMFNRPGPRSDGFLWLLDEKNLSPYATIVLGRFRGKPSAY
nr:809_t:CDS:2 [Entrophospora candida]